MDSCSLNEPCSLIGSPSAVPLRATQCAAWPSAPCFSVPPSPLPCEVGGSDDAGLRTELGEPDARDLPVRACGDPLLQGARRRLTQQLPRGGDPAAEDEHARIQDGGERGHAVPEPDTDHPERFEGCLV